MHLVGFVISIYHDARSPVRQISLRIVFHIDLKLWAFARLQIFLFGINKVFTIDAFSLLHANFFSEKEIGRTDGCIVFLVIVHGY